MTPGPQARGAGKGAWLAGPASRPGGLAPPEAAGSHLRPVGLPGRRARPEGMEWWGAVAERLRSLEAGRRQKPGLPRGTGPGTGRHGRGARWVPRPNEAELPQPEALALRLWGSLDFPPRARPPPAGPRRRLPYLRSPGPPFYFLKPSHKAPRPAPGLSLLSAGRILRLRIPLDSARARRRVARTRQRSAAHLRSNGSPPTSSSRLQREGGVASAARRRTDSTSLPLVLRSQHWQRAKGGRGGGKDVRAPRMRRRNTPLFAVLTSISLLFLFVSLA